MFANSIFNSLEPSKPEHETKSYKTISSISHAMNFVSILFLGLVASQCGAALIRDSIELAARELPPMGPFPVGRAAVYARQGLTDGDLVGPVLPVALSADERALLATIYAHQIGPVASAPISAPVATDENFVRARQLLEPVQPLPVAVSDKFVRRQEPVGPTQALPVAVSEGKFARRQEPVEPSQPLPVAVSDDFVRRQEPVEPTQPLPVSVDDAGIRVKIATRQIGPTQPLPVSATDADERNAILTRQIGPVRPVEAVQPSEKESAVLARILTRQLNSVATGPTATDETFVRAKSL